jgi:pyruvate/2-oxoglutarate/acetoin dehydrogenase E1 component
VASKDAPVPAAPVLEQAVLPQVADIVAAVREAVA